MSKKNIYIYISDVASFIGQNPWDYITSFERLWKKCDEDTYLDLYNQTNIELQYKQLELQKLEYEKEQLCENLNNKKITSRQYDIGVNKITKEKTDIQESMSSIQEKVDAIHLTQQQKLEKVIGQELITKLTTDTIDTATKRELLTTAIKTLDLDDTKIQNIKEQGESFINKTHGTLRESDAIDMFEAKYNIKLDTSQKFNKMLLTEASYGSKYNWFVCGKVDGLYIDSKDITKNFIVEVKNRTRGFFNNFRDYEKTQIHLYMEMLEIPRSKLVEKYGEKIRVKEIYKDVQYTIDIIDYLNIFITNFEKDFLTNLKTKTRYIQSTKEEKQKYIQNTFFNRITRYINEKNKVESESEECYINDLN